MSAQCGEEETMIVVLAEAEMAADHLEPMREAARNRQRGTWECIRPTKSVAGIPAITQSSFGSSAASSAVV